MILFSISLYEAHSWENSRKRKDAERTTSVVISIRECALFALSSRTAARHVMSGDVRGFLKRSVCQLAVPLKSADAFHLTEKSSSLKFLRTDNPGTFQRHQKVESSEKGAGEVPLGATDVDIYIHSWRAIVLVEGARHVMEDDLGVHDLQQQIAAENLFRAFVKARQPQETEEDIQRALEEAEKIQQETSSSSAATSPIVESRVEIADRLVNIADEIDSRYHDEFEEMVERLRLTPENAYGSFSELAMRLLRRGELVTRCWFRLGFSFLFFAF